MSDNKTQHVLSTSGSSVSNKIHPSVINNVFKSSNTRMSMTESAPVLSTTYKQMTTSALPQSTAQPASITKSSEMSTKHVSASVVLTGSSLSTTEALTAETQKMSDTKTQHVLITNRSSVSNKIHFSVNVSKYSNIRMSMTENVPVLSPTYKQMTASALPQSTVQPASITKSSEMSTKYNVSTSVVLTVNGKWTEWSSWSSCNRPCGTGYQTKTRSCSNPAPGPGGNMCAGMEGENNACNQWNCPAVKVNLDANLTDEVWSDELNDLGSERYVRLWERIKDSLNELYKDDPTSKFREFFNNSLRRGSVIANFNITFDSVESIQILLLQEEMIQNSRLQQIKLTLNNITADKVPSAAPQIILAESLDSTTARVLWHNITEHDLQGFPLTGFSLFHRLEKENYQEDNMISVSPANNNTVISGLQEFTKYFIRVVAFTESGNGIFSEPVNVTTQEGVPKKKPHLTVRAIGPTTISIAWTTIDKNHVPGILKGYNIRVATKQSHGSHVVYRSADPDMTSLELGGLHVFTEYSVRICAFTSKGCGPTDESVVQTLEDVPSHAPEVEITDLKDDDTITINWHPLDQSLIRGELKGYVVTTRLLRRYLRPVKDTKEKTYDIKPGQTSLTLTNLKPFSEFEIEVAAKSGAGTGARRKILGRTCRCRKAIYTNHWSLPPYLKDSTKDDSSGIFASIIDDMIQWSCGNCVNGHGKTTLDLSTDGQGGPAMKESMIEVLKGVGENRISFPINGNEDMSTYKGVHGFVFLVRSPGMIFVTLPDPPDTSALAIMNAVLQCVPVLILMLCLMFLSGIIMWATAAWSGDDNFHPSFITGASEGFWWAFVTMTTVGYGDFYPKSVPSRLYGILWVFVGLVVMSLLTSSITTSLLTVNVDHDIKLYGTKVATVQNSTEYRMALLLNARVNTERQYKNVEDVKSAVVNREVKGMVLDTYVAAEHKDWFTDGNLRVTKVLDRPLGYGFVLSGEIMELQGQFEDYINVKAARISQIIEENTEKIEKAQKEVEDEASTNLFDSGSVLFHNTAYFLLALLTIAVLAGLAWHYGWWKRGKRVFADLNMSHAQSINLLKKEMKQDLHHIVQQFHESMREITIEMTARHKIERRKLMCRN